MNDTSETPNVTRVEAAPTKDPAVRCFIGGAMAIGLAIWCYSDRQPPPEAWDFKHINEVLGYLLNNWGPLVFVPLGLILAGLGIRHLVRKMVADEEGIGYEGGKRIAWTDIKQLDVSRLQSKGILHLHSGEGKKVTLDSWKMRNFRDLVAFVEKKVPQDLEKV